MATSVGSDSCQLTYLKTNNRFILKTVTWLYCGHRHYFFYKMSLPSPVWVRSNSDGKASLRVSSLSIDAFGSDDEMDLRALIKDSEQRKCFQYNVPRLQSIYCKIPMQYKFGGAPRTREGFPKSLEKLRQAVFPESDLAVLNFYRDGKDSLAWHNDNDKIVDTTRIVSVSFGSKRKFSLRTPMVPRKRHDMELHHRDVVEMLGSFQASFEHSVPKEPKHVGLRMNVTFRKLL